MVAKKDLRGNLKLPPALHKELLHYTVDEDITLAEAVQRAWDSLRESPGTIPTGEEAAAYGNLIPAKGELPWVQRLLMVLRSENQIVAKAIQQNLLAFSLVVDLASERPGTGHAGEADLSPEIEGAIRRAAGAVESADRAAAKHRGNRGASGRDQKRAG